MMTGPEDHSGEKGSGVEVQEFVDQRSIAASARLFNDPPGPGTSITEDQLFMRQQTELYRTPEQFEQAGGIELAHDISAGS